MVGDVSQPEIHSKILFKSQKQTNKKLGARTRKCIPFSRSVTELSVDLEMLTFSVPQFTSLVYLTRILRINE
jgi:hypothetical protein